MSIDNLKGYFEHFDDKNNIVGRVKDKNNIVGTAKHDQYLTIIFNNEYQKTMFTEILKRIDKDINIIILELNSKLIMICQQTF